MAAVTHRARAGAARTNAREITLRFLAEPGDDAGRVARLYRLAYARPPGAAESERALAFLAGPDGLLPPPKGMAPPTSDRLREERWASLCQVVFASAEFRTLR